LLWLGRCRCVPSISSVENRPPRERWRGCSKSLVASSLMDYLQRCREEPGMAVQISRGVRAAVGFVAGRVHNFCTGRLGARVMCIDIIQINKHTHSSQCGLMRADHAPVLGALAHHDTLAVE